jgi:hypothetical protein
MPNHTLKHYYSTTRDDNYNILSLEGYYSNARDFMTNIPIPEDI